MSKKPKEKKSLYEWHYQSGLSVQEFADAAGLTIDRASAYLYGKAEPVVTRAIQMAQALKVQVEDVDWKLSPSTQVYPPMPEGEGATPERLAVAKIWLAKGRTKVAVAKELGVTRQKLYDLLPQS